MGITSLAAATDRDLALAAKDGDSDALRALIDRHDQRLRRMCVPIAGAQADDAVQETWIRVMKGITNFKPDNVGGWLSVIAKNEAFRAVSGSSHAEPDADLDQTPGPHTTDPYTHARRAEIAEGFHGALKKLPMPQREALVRDALGEAPRETREALGTTAGAVRIRRHRARQTMREALAPLDPSLN